MAEHNVSVKITVPNWIEEIIVWPVLIYRKWRYGYSFRRIKLTQGQYAIVDPEDFERLSVFKWRATYSRNTIYAIRSKTVARKRSFEMMHRAVMEMKLEAEYRIQNSEVSSSNPKSEYRNPKQIQNANEANTKLVIDHINHNGLDNRKANLRIATIAENCRNRRMRTGGSSKYRGVTYRKTDGMYIAEIRAKERMYLGCFKSEIEAAKAYDAAARKYHGEFASLNFPD